MLREAKTFHQVSNCDQRRSLRGTVNVSQTFHCGSRTHCRCCAFLLTSPPGAINLRLFSHSVLVVGVARLGNRGRKTQKTEAHTVDPLALKKAPFFNAQSTSRRRSKTVDIAFPLPELRTDLSNIWFSDDERVGPNSGSLR